MSKTFINLQKEIETNEKDIHSLRSLLTLGNRSIVLKEKKSQEEKKLKNCSIFNFSVKSSCKTAIEELDNQIKVSIKIEELEEKNEELAKNQKDYCPGNVWSGYPDILDDKIRDKYAEKFEALGSLY